jgi:hypothetical protein
LEVEGLYYKRRFKDEMIDQKECFRLLLRYKADPNAELFGKRRKPRLIFEAVKQPYEYTKTLLKYIHDKDKVVN